MSEFDTAELADWREPPAATEEDRALRERRLKIRCWRRGTKEMDLILGGYFNACVPSLSSDALSTFEALLREDDATLYQWISGAVAPPEDFAKIVAAIRAQHALT